MGIDGGIRRSKAWLQVAYSLNGQTDLPLQQAEEGSLRSRAKDTYVDLSPPADICAAYDAEPETPWESGPSAS